MNATLQKEIEEALGENLCRGVRIVNSRAVGGGCINTCEVVKTDGGERYFVKSNAGVAEDFFTREAEGLLAIAATESLRVPKPIVAGGGPQGETAKCAHFLIMEYLESARPCDDFDEKMGRGLAGMHRATAEQFGLDADNFIGTTEQPNLPHESWAEFFATRRLGHQLDVARRRGYATAELEKGIDLLTAKLPDLFGNRAPLPSLLHGDLWGGNFMIGPEGEPVLIDPAVYYGDREADLAMTELFGRFESVFYSAYEEAWSLDAGYEERRDIYNLYHLMNHMNLFGLSYMSGVMNIVRRYT